MESEYIMAIDETVSPVEITLEASNKTIIMVRLLRYNIGIPEPPIKVGFWYNKNNPSENRYFELPNY